MNAKISVFVICFEAIIYLLLYNLHDCAFTEKLHFLYTDAIYLIFIWNVLKNILER